MAHNGWRPNEAACFRRETNSSAAAISAAPPGTRNVDPITLPVVRGALEKAQREIPLSLEKTARSSVFNLARHYSTALFNG